MKRTEYLFYGCILLTVFLVWILFQNFTKGREKQEDLSVPERMKQYNVIFAGTIRNVERYLAKGLSHIDQCGQKFNQYAVVLYENDSVDATRAILQQSKKSNYHYLLEDKVSEPRRTMRIAHGRNRILDKVRELNADNTYDFLIMLDIDDVNDSGKFVQSIESCFLYEDWDVLTGNQTGTYYDLWALRKEGDLDYDCILKVAESDPKDEVEAFLKYWKSKDTLHYPQGHLHEVDSAFGGIAIYRLKAVPPQCRYVGSYPNGMEKCEHVDFHTCIKAHGGRMYLNTSFLTG